MAIKVYRTTDRITVQIGEATFKLSPLTFQQKMELSSCFETIKGQEVQDLTRTNYLAIKYAVKDVAGIEYADGSSFKLTFDGKVLEDECVEELMSTEVTAQLMVTCSSLINGISDEIINPITGKPMKGIKIIPSKGNPTVKKSVA